MDEASTSGPAVAQWQFAGKDPAGLRILVSNDDGIHAPGLGIMEAIARDLSDDVWVVAPALEQSGASHSLTLHDPIRIDQLGEKRFAVRGTPTDCVGIAVKAIITDRRPDLVLSGVNRGSNLAEDVTYSGTIAAAMEGTMLGIPSMAFSQARGFRSTEGDVIMDHEDVAWHTAGSFGPRIVRALLERAWPDGVLWNINFPDVEPEDVTRFEITRQGRRDVNNLFIDSRKDARGRPYYWLGFNRRLSNPPEGTDLRAIYNGRISATPLHLDLTYPGLVDEAAAVLNGSPP